MMKIKKSILNSRKNNKLKEISFKPKKILKLIMTNIKLSVNDEKIPLNQIMGNVLTNIISGFIDALKGIPEDITKIKVEISF
ncbi:MAG: hypothetical protein ACFFAN_08175 [Promethearchaeota archaeon]